MTTAMPLDPLDQLEGFLSQDPGNEGLRAETFETALRLGRLDRAAVHLEAGLAAGAHSLAWRLRRAHWHMARRDWTAANTELTSLVGSGDVPAALDEAARHDLALIALRTGEPEIGLAWLAPLAGEGVLPAPTVQALWLRLQHHSADLEALLAQAKVWESAAGLGADAAGVAALAALDANEPDLSIAWARAALSSLPCQMEALVTQGTLALARQQVLEAKQWLQQALQVNPADGRAWSAWAFAEMLAGDLAAARVAFERAMQTMPQHIGTWLGMGWAAILVADWPAARAAFEQALTLDRNFSESHGGLAVVQARQGDRQAAEARIAIALRLDRQCMSAQYAQTVLDGRAGDRAHVQQLATKLLSARREPQ